MHRESPKARELRKAINAGGETLVYEPNYGPGYVNPHYFGGYRNAEDEADAEARGPWPLETDEEIEAAMVARAQKAAA